ncbi:MAG: ABC transporter permease [Jatrophihabitans sp.]
MTDVSQARDVTPSGDVAGLVERHHLRLAGARPRIVDYTRELWGRRHFIFAFSTANNAVGYSRSFLGQAWQLLTPLLNAGVYYLIFGVLLHTKRGIHNYIAFLVIGIFVFTFTQTSMLGGARAISSNLGLTRVLQFPRAVLPVSSTMIALQRLLSSMVIMLPIVLLTGEPLTLKWLLLIPALVLQSMFCLGLAFFIARVGAKVPDTSQVLPFVLRTWLYLSGVFYSVTTFTKGHAHWVKVVLDLNPGAVYVEIVRGALLREEVQGPYEWPLAVGWAVVVLVVGYVYFWHAEEQYGRV